MMQLIFNGDDFLVVTKPISVSVHCDNHVQGFAAMLSEQLSIKLYVVHRLDKVTSGLMLFAKSAQAAAEFGEMFEKRKIKKFYLAISKIKPKKKQGTIKGDMVKSRRSAWILKSTQKNPAITRFFSQYVDGFRLFLVKPETGKTHQIRVALKSLGSAIYGDPIYSDTIKEQPDSQTIADRCYLHAWQLSFSFKGEAYRFRSDPESGEVFIQDNIIAALQKWQQPECLQWSKSR